MAITKTILLTRNNTTILFQLPHLNTFSGHEQQKKSCPVSRLILIQEVIETKVISVQHFQGLTLRCHIYNPYSFIPTRTELGSFG